MINPALAVRIEQLKAIASYIDNGSGYATVVFYEGTQVANTTIAADNSKRLVTLTLPKPSLKDVNSDNITLQPSDTATIIKSGTAVWARLYNADGITVADFAVGTDITLATPSLVVNNTLTINSITLRPST